MVNPNEMVNNFARVVGDSLSEFGVINGQLIYLAGSVLTPIEEERPFDYRLKFLGAFVSDNHITVSEEQKMFYIDPDNVAMVGSDLNEELCAIRDKDFKKEEQTIMADETTG